MHVHVHRSCERTHSAVASCLIQLDVRPRDRGPSGAVPTPRRKAAKMGATPHHERAGQRSVVMAGDPVLPPWPHVQPLLRDTPLPWPRPSPPVEPRPSRGATPLPRRRHLRTSQKRSGNKCCPLSKCPIGKNKKALQCPPGAAHRASAGTCTHVHTRAL